MGKRYLASVANVELFIKENGALQHYASANTLTDSGLGFTVSMEEIRAGQGGKIYGRFAHSSGLTLSMTDVMWDIKYVRALIGAESSGVGASVIYTQQITGGAEATLDKSAVQIGTICGMSDYIAWGHKVGCEGEGDDLTFTITGDSHNKVTAPGTSSDTYCISYFVNDPAAVLTKIKAKFIPSELVAVMTIQEFAGDASAKITGKPVGYLTVKIPRLQLDGQFDLALAMTSSATIALNGTALAVSSGGCDDEDYYGEIVETLTDATPVVEIVVDQDYLTTNDVPRVYGIDGSGNPYRMNNDILTFAPTLSSAGKWSTTGSTTVTYTVGSTTIDTDTVTIS